jgi:uncharacterized membrane protein
MILNSGRLLNMIGIILFVAVGVLLIVVYPRLPDVMPTKADFSGEFVGFGSKSVLISVYFLGIGLWIIAGIIGRLHLRKNWLPEKLLDPNQQRLYEAKWNMAKSGTQYSRFTVAIIMNAVVFLFILAGLGLISSIGWALAILVAVAVALMIFDAVRVYRFRRR